MRRRITAAAVAALALAGAAGAAGCGGDEPKRTATAIDQTQTQGAGEAAGPQSAPPTDPTPAAPAATTTAPAPTATATTPTATTGVPKGGGAPDTGGTPADSEQQPGGAGDEQGARVPAAFTLAGGAISPARITVPAFLAVEVALTAKDGAQQVTISAPGGGTVDVASGATARRSLAGLRPGDYTVATAGGAKATLHVVSGGAPGP